MKGHASAGFNGILLTWALATAAPACGYESGSVDAATDGPDADDAAPADGSHDTTVDPPGPDPGVDPFADPPDGGYPPGCSTASTCCSDPPTSCSGGWDCVDMLCMWVCGDEAYHVSCTAHAECDCYPAPVRCVGTWQCIAGTCWYFCDEG